MTSDSCRSVKVLKDGKWLDIEFPQIKHGDIVKLYEPSGEPVRGYGGVTKFQAVSDAYIDIEHNVYTFAMKEVR
jgi:hypothetical protein